MAPIRNLGRIRNPSSKAIEAAETPVLPTARRRAPSTRNKKPGALPAPPPAPLKGRKGRGGRSGAASSPVEDIAEEDEARAEQRDHEKEPDLTLYCICLGYDTGETPMIQCDVCSNWFHFNCINLSEQDAGDIEAYVCDICDEMGGGKTRRISDAPQPALAKTKAPVKSKSKSKAKAPAASRSSSSGEDDGDSDAHMSSLSSLSDAEESAEEDDGDEDPLDDVDDDDDIDSEEEVSRRLRSSRKRPSKNDGKRVAKRKVSAGAVAADEDQEYTGDAESVLRDARASRRRSSQTKKAAPAARKPLTDDEDDTPSPPVTSRPRPPRRQPSQASPGASTSSAGVTSTPTTDKTRTHVTTQLTSTFQSIYAASEDEVNTLGVQARATAFAESIEAELFDGFGEVDAKGIKGPRAKYIAKFRSLIFNLKSNAAFRSRISANEFSPTQIVNLTNEDLLTPELKAYAESVRAASLKDSVKEVITAPTAKRTHKGEEAIDSAGAGLVAEEERLLSQRDRQDLVERERQVTQKRERSSSFAHGSPALADSPSFVQGSPPRQYGSPGSMVFSPKAESLRSPTTTTQDGAMKVDSPIEIQSPPVGGSPVQSPRSRSATEIKFESPSAIKSESPVPVSLSEVEVEQPLPALTRNRPSFSAATVSISADDLGLDFDHTPGGSPPSAAVPSSSKSEDDITPLKEDGGPMLPPPPRQRSSFDMASAWGQIKPSPTLPSVEKFEPTSADLHPDEVGTGAPAASSVATDPVEFVDAFELSRKASIDHDDFEASLLYDAPKSKPPTSTSKAPVVSPVPPVASSTPRTKPISELEPIWVGDLIVPDEGGFPAFGVQIGGRPFGTAPVIWNQLMPKGLTMDGRIPTPIANKYLVDCSFAPSRELVVVGLLPDQTGPSEYFPHKPTGPSCLNKYAHIIKFYVGRDRIGVVAPPDSIKHVVKDVYIIPLRKTDPLPEYVELLEAHDIPETGHREEDMLLCVLVMIKDSLPSEAAPASTAPTPSSQTPSSSSNSVPAPAPSSQSLASAFTPAPSSSATQPLDPQALRSILQGADTNGLSSLLADPTVLQSLVSGMDTAATQSLLGNPNLLAALGDSPNSANLLSTLQNVGAGTSAGSGGGQHQPSRWSQRWDNPSPASSQQNSNVSDATWQNPQNPANAGGYGSPEERRGGYSHTPGSPPRGRGGYVHPSRAGFVGEGGSGSRGFGYGDEDWDSRGRGGRGGRGGPSRGGGRGGPRGGYGGPQNGGWNGGRGGGRGGGRY